MYACAAAAERTTDALARTASEMIRNRRSECIRSPERQHLNRRILIRKRSTCRRTHMEPARPRAALTPRWIGFSGDDAQPNRRRRKYLIDLSALPWRG